MEKTKPRRNEDGLVVYDFSNGERGAVVSRPVDTSKSKVTIRLDDDVIDHFMREAEKTGGRVGYQTLINQALRQQMGGEGASLLEALRLVVREEIERSRLTAST